MDIAITNVAGTTKNFYEFPSDVGAALVAAGIARPIVKPQALPAALTTKWFVRQLQSGKWCIQLHRPGGETNWFTATPETYQKAGLRYADTTCPTDVIEEYARRWVPVSIG